MIDATEDLKRVSKMAEERGIILTTQDVCFNFNVSSRTIQTWMNEGMPVKDRGGKGKAATFYSAAVSFWWLSRELKKKFGEVPRDFILEWERDWLLLDLERAKSEIGRLTTEA